MSFPYPLWSSSGPIHEVRHRKKWQPHQTLKYRQFIIQHKSILEVSDRNKKHQIYNKMAEYIQTRNTHQCRSHHQKVIKRFGSIDNFCLYLKENPGKCRLKLPCNQVPQYFDSEQKELVFPNGQPKLQSLQNGSKNLEPCVKFRQNMDYEAVKQRNYGQKINFSSGSQDSQSNSDYKPEKEHRKMPMVKKHLSLAKNTLIQRKKRSEVFQSPKEFLCRRCASHIGSLGGEPVNFENRKIPDPNQFLKCYNEAEKNGQIKEKSLSEKLTKLIDYQMERQPGFSRLKVLDEAIGFLGTLKIQQVIKNSMSYEKPKADLMPTGDYDEDQKALSCSRPQAMMPLNNFYMQPTAYKSFQPFSMPQHNVGPSYSWPGSPGFYAGEQHIQGMMNRYGRELQFKPYSQAQNNPD